MCVRAGLAGFKSAVKKSRSESTSSAVKPYVKQASIKRDESVFSHLSHFSTEDIPIASSPSPFPGRRTFPGTEEMAAGSDDEDNEFEVCLCVYLVCCVMYCPPLSQAIGTEEEEEEGEEATPNDEEVGKGVKTKSSVKHLVKKRPKKAKSSDQESTPPTFVELLKLNKPDWPFVLVGVIFSAIIGCLFPLQAVLFSDILRVSEQNLQSSML